MKLVLHVRDCTAHLQQIEIMEFELERVLLDGRQVEVGLN